MPRRKQTAAEYMEANAVMVPLIIGDLVEHLGQAAQAWSQAVVSARLGDLDRALKHVVDVEIAVDIPLRIGRSELRTTAVRAGNLLDAELPDDDEDEPPS